MSSTDSEKLEEFRDEKSENRAVTEQYEDATSIASVDARAEKALVRKIDRRILPILCLMYLAAYLDRSNIGNARTMPQSIDAVLGGDPTGILFNWITSMFYFSYILYQLPATILAKLFPPNLYLGISAIGWGVCSTLMSTGFNFGSLMVCRLFLGAFEAMFGPGIPLYFTHFYTKHEIGLRMAYWFSFAAVAGAFGGLIAFGVAQTDTAVAQWRLLFIIDGIPAVLIGVVALKVLPGRPECTNFFNEDERKIALVRRNRGTSGDRGYKIQKRHIWSAFFDWRIYAGGVIYFAANAVIASISAFLPTILTTLNYADAEANLMTVPPYAVTAVVLTGTSWVSDRIQLRGPFVCLSATIGAIGYLILLTVHDNAHVRYFAVFCIVAGTYTVIGITIAWYAHNLGSETKLATGTPIYQAIGQCGSVLGSHLFPKTRGPLYERDFAVLCALEFSAAISAAILVLHYKRENSRRDRIYGKVHPDSFVDTSELADKAPNFRYIP
ncbi:MFS general substrate transporter [Peniophora sp. CONT]|nr:MFS general substrate transporter [Peniophora sp. CONT]